MALPPPSSPYPPRRHTYIITATRKLEGGGASDRLAFLAPAHPDGLSVFFFETCCLFRANVGGCFTLSGPIGDVGGRMPLPMSVCVCEI